MKPAFSTEKWLALVVSLPTVNATLRMRVWRAMKGLGCAVLRDGVYLLPAGRGLRQALRMHAEDIKQGGGSAYLLNVTHPSTEEKIDFQGLFDRSEDYFKLMGRITEFKTAIGSIDAAAGRRQLKALWRDFEALVALDYFSSHGKVEADALLTDAETLFLASLSADEPKAVPGSVTLRDAADYQGCQWATRRHLWVDRMASAWLIRRFIDPEARFLWLEQPEDCPDDALGFDFDGAEFTHVGQRVTFEVLLASFGLESDTSLTKLGALVHCLDVGGMPVAEAAGVEMVLGGLRVSQSDDDALLAAAGGVFDGIYMNFKTGESI
ncbi:ChrB [Sulfuricella sp. T08]|uniref:chromate resistance protein ChrB domain-containing protein n=1 Tax=Sulfuricella sp. T08 TaxID=1632857 RepID=UPI0006179A12|nr:chromate resistance protein ChrB domain-containing protein [Sulfuricella sp. T08]GAO37661.1 ChrB [Sulfuricella sp. T08]